MTKSHPMPTFEPDPKPVSLRPIKWRYAREMRWINRLTSSGAVERLPTERQRRIRATVLSWFV